MYHCNRPCFTKTLRVFGENRKIRKSKRLMRPDFVLYWKNQISYKNVVLKRNIGELMLLDRRLAEDAMLSLLNNSMKTTRKLCIEISIENIRKSLGYRSQNCRGDQISLFVEYRARYLTIIGKTGGRKKNTPRKKNNRRQFQFVVCHDIITVNKHYPLKVFSLPSDINLGYFKGRKLYLPMRVSNEKNDRY